MSRKDKIFPGRYRRKVLLWHLLQATDYRRNFIKEVNTAEFGMLAVM
jgi:hypothetical protein